MQLFSQKFDDAKSAKKPLKRPLNLEKNGKQSSIFDSAHKRQKLDNLPPFQPSIKNAGRGQFMSTYNVFWKDYDEDSEQDLPPSHVIEPKFCGNSNSNMDNFSQLKPISRIFPEPSKSDNSKKNESEVRSEISLVRQKIKYFAKIPENKKLFKIQYTKNIGRQFDLTKSNIDQRK